MTRIKEVHQAWIFESKDIQDALESLIRELSATKAKSLGWTMTADDDHIRRQFKSVLTLHL